MLGHSCSDLNETTFPLRVTPWENKQVLLANNGTNYFLAPLITLFGGMTLDSFGLLLATITDIEFVPLVYLMRCSLTLCLLFLSYIVS